MIQEKALEHLQAETMVVFILIEPSFATTVRLQSLLKAHPEKHIH